MQETAGIDLLSDGEWRRPHFHDFIARRIAGFTPLTVQGYYSAVVAPLQVTESLTADEARFLLAQSTHAVKIALPSPYLMARRMFHPVESTRAYPTPEAVMAALVPILRRELGTLRDLGVALVQFDDPAIGVLGDRSQLQNFGEPDRGRGGPIRSLNQLGD